MSRPAYEDYDLVFNHVKHIKDIYYRPGTLLFSKRCFDIEDVNKILHIIRADNSVYIAANEQDNRFGLKLTLLTRENIIVSVFEPESELIEAPHYYFEIGQQ